MSGFLAKDWASALTTRLEAYPGLRHLRVTARADTLSLVSGAEDNPFAHTRLRRISATLWTVEMPTRGNRWQPTGVRGNLDQAIATLTEQYGWILEPVD